MQHGAALIKKEAEMLHLNSKSDAAVSEQESEQDVKRAAKPARPKYIPERTVEALAKRESAALREICFAASMGAAAAGKEAVEAVSWESSPFWYIRQRASEAVANEKYFQI